MEATIEEEDQKWMRMEEPVIAVEVELQWSKALKMAKDVDLGWPEKMVGKGLICVVHGDHQRVKIEGHISK